MRHSVRRDRDGRLLARACCLALAAMILMSCAAPTRSRPAKEPKPQSGDYLRYVAFDLGGGDKVLLRWHERQMPLKIHLGAPATGDFDDPEAVTEVVRDGITDWTDVAGEGVPSFEFVDDPGDADIPIVWERALSGSWYIAHCVLEINYSQRRFGVARILVTAKASETRRATYEELYLTMLHEMGHALGLGHSPVKTDVMYKGGGWYLEKPELSSRDRETLRLLYSRPQGSRVVGARRAD